MFQIRACNRRPLLRLAWYSTNDSRSLLRACWVLEEVLLPLGVVDPAVRPESNNLVIEACDTGSLVPCA